MWLILSLLLMHLGIPVVQPAGGLMQGDTEKQILERGLKAEEAGNFKLALETWKKAKETLPEPGTEIGRQFIRLATEQGMEDYFETASKIYLWGLSGDKVSTNKIALDRELQFLEPILEKSERKRFEQLVEDGHPDIYKQLADFWNKLDPTPSTPYNERLIEHWQRIAYAREHFTRSDESVYGTDERGPVYVEYGKPDLMFNGHLNITRREITLLMSDWRIPRTNRPYMLDAVFKFHIAPEYELWIYKSPNKKMRYNLVQLFGERAESGEFTKLRTVEDFIPNRAFTYTRRYEDASSLGAQRSGGLSAVRSNASPGMILQWLYYEELSNKDFFFADQFKEMLFSWNSFNNGPGKYQGQNLKHKHIHETEENLSAAPVHISTLEKEFPGIPLQVYQYRLLNEENKPVLATYLESYCRDAFMSDLAFNFQKLNPDITHLENKTIIKESVENYKLVQGLQLRNENWVLLSHNREEEKLRTDLYRGLAVNRATFIIPNMSGEIQQVFYSELHNLVDETTPWHETPFPDYLRGLAKVQFTQPEPLDNNPDVLQMGDLMIGYKKVDSTYAYGSSPASFTVAHDQKIPEGRDLSIHVEVYHLKPGPDGISRFQLEYEILPVNFLGWTKERKNEFRVTLNLETDKRRYAEDLEIKTGRLKTGKYVLRLKAVQHETGREIKREIHFNVVE